MGTRCAIVVKVGRWYRGVYSHMDGYPSHAGKILKENYDDFNKAKDLVSNGDIYSLREKLGRQFDPNDTWEKMTRDMSNRSTILYIRDGNVTDPTYRTKTGSLKNVLDKISDFAYSYVYENGQWIVDGELTIDEAIAKETEDTKSYLTCD